MKAYIISSGEYNVGIMPLKLEIDLGIEEFENTEEREETRKKLNDTFSFLHGDIGVEFEDERNRWLNKEEEFCSGGDL